MATLQETIERAAKAFIARAKKPSADDIIVEHLRGMPANRELEALKAERLKKLLVLTKGEREQRAIALQLRYPKWQGVSRHKKPERPTKDRVKYLEAMEEINRRLRGQAGTEVQQAHKELAAEAGYEQRAWHAIVNQVSDRVQVMKGRGK